MGTTTLGDALLAPTRIYAPQVKKLLGSHDIRGMAHITGGGLTENIVRIVPDHLGLEIDSRAWPRPELFSWLQKAGNIADAEMRRAFNQESGRASCREGQEQW